MLSLSTKLQSVWTVERAPAVLWMKDCLEPSPAAWLPSQAVLRLNSSELQSVLRLDSSLELQTVLRFVILLKLQAVLTLL